MNRVKAYKIIEAILILCVWFTLDRIAKIFVSSHAVGEKITDSILGIFHITFVKNTGAAFGLFADNPIPLAIISIVISVILITLLIIAIWNTTNNQNYKYKLTQLHIFSVCIVSAGGIANAFDRIAYHYVIDYIDLDLFSWPVFNIADIGVTCGVVLLIMAMLASSIKNNSDGKINSSKH